MFGIQGLAIHSIPELPNFMITALPPPPKEEGGKGLLILPKPTQWKSRNEAQRS